MANPTQAAAEQALGNSLGGLGSLGINSGGGAITPDLGSSASNKGGNNSLGGFKFGNYYASTNYTPFIIGAVVLAVIWYMVKGKKRR